MTIEEIVNREIMQFDEPIPCSATCRKMNYPFNHTEDCPSLDENRIVKLGRAVARAVVEQCAQVAEDHRPPAFKMKRLFESEQAYQERASSIQDEQRGERIAAECIAKTLRALAAQGTGGEKGR